MDGVMDGDSEIVFTLTELMTSCSTVVVCCIINVNIVNAVLSKRALFTRLDYNDCLTHSLHLKHLFLAVQLNICLYIPYRV